MSMGPPGLVMDFERINNVLQQADFLMHEPYKEMYIWIEA